MKLEPVPFPAATDLRVCRAAADPRLEDETVPIGVGNAAVLSRAWMVRRKHETRDGSMLSLEFRIPLMPSLTVAAPAQRLRRAFPAAQTRGDQVLVASRVANEGGLAKDALAHSSVSRKR